MMVGGWGGAGVGDVIYQQDIHSPLLGQSVKPISASAETQHVIREVTMALTGSVKVEVLSIQRVTHTSQVSGWGKGLNLTYNLTGQKDGEWRGSRVMEM